MKTWSDFGIDIPPGARGEIDTTCPQCSGRRKKSNARCLSVNVDDGTWFCHHCGWSGGLGTGQRSASDPDPYGEPLKPKEWQKPRPIPAVTQPTQWQRAVAWFQSERGIPESVLTRNGVTVATEWCPVCEEHTSHVLFPYERVGVHVNTKHRCVRKHFRMEKGAERILYGIDDATNHPTWIWVEGEIDKLSFEVAGFLNVVSVPDGAPPPDAKHYAGKFAFLESAEGNFHQHTKHVIAVDADAPGRALEAELVRRLGPERCSRVTWPEGIKDANECLVNIGPGYLKECVDRAEAYPVEGIVRVSDLARDLDDLYDHGFDRGVESGWHQFDKHYRSRTGLFTVVTGIAGHGKSHFLDALLVNLAVRHGWTFAICSPENQPLKRHAAGIITTYQGQPFHDGPNPRMSKPDMHRARDWMDQHFAFVLPEEPTIDAILERVRVLVYRMGCKGVVVDPWNELEHSRPASMSETEYISGALGSMRRFARHHDVHLWLVAHPTKLKRDEDGNEPVPTLWDISGSAHFRNKCDAGFVIWRDLKDATKPVLVDVQKIRFAETGELGIVGFSYDRLTGRYREA